jgi:hypothetical protein
MNERERERDIKTYEKLIVNPMFIPILNIYNFNNHKAVKLTQCI